MQCAMMLVIVAAGYFYKVVWINIAVLVVLVIWGCFHNKEILLPMWNTVKEKLVHKG